MRFVVQDHITENRHFDLMIETDGDLLPTWRIMPSDLDRLLNGQEIKAVRIRDHEKRFLDYEGSLSAGNGSVKIFDRGNSELLKQNDRNITAAFSGRVLKGTLRLVFLKENEYRVRYFPGYAK